MRNLKKKMMSDRKTGYTPLNAENNRDVNYDVMFAYVRTKLNFLLSVLSIYFVLFFYDFNLNTQGFVYLEFVKYQVPPKKRASFCSNAMYPDLLYSCLIYRHAQAFFQYQNKPYIFPMLGLAKK